MSYKKIGLICLFTLGLNLSSTQCKSNTTQRSFGLDKIVKIVNTAYKNKDIVAYAAIVSPLFYMYNKVLFEMVFEKYLNKKSSEQVN